ncbi:Murein DD-endopeptidase MepM and murein hydrolase activator NlpD, contain LysM domain [Desulfuromusa kysingii]|uniref:Murein DD-endopeptidase MepM and murein hydrolase activator NlpD, contain LysM domain n=1 Tax=Desulfuromusa kysingii TaxID=37625 RepID=A0A1H4C3Q8_9BACT|nr:M23 family metallopeptidase [Desulfuromusa kysingii]SEA55041.1 Murein DD-endopeptidase MepM and murein hydrolase activator NlpD, contain LysM domain [Desulfuromusa kysingii]
MARRFSLIIIPEENRKVSSLRLHSGMVKAAICGCCLSVGFSVFFAYQYFNFNMDYAELQQLRLSNIEQQQTLLSLTADLNNVQQQMNDLAESEARVRQLAALEALPEDVPVAIGGIQEFDPMEDVDAIQRQINKLQVAIELRRQSQEGVRNLLNDQVSLSRATPKGWPTKGWLTSYFGMRKSPFSGRQVMHEGLDIAANTGTPVVATADGIVSRVRYSRDYGKMVVIDHGYGYRTIFAHNSKVLVKAGQRVKRGDMISQVGNTGRSTGSHLHYELRLNGVPIDPRKTL